MSKGDSESFKKYLGELEEAEKSGGLWKLFEETDPAAEPKTQDQESTEINQNAHFGDIRDRLAVLVSEEYPKLVEELTQIDLDNAAKGLAGFERSGMDAYLEIAAHLKMFDDLEFKESVTVKPSFWGLVKNEIYKKEENPDSLLTLLYYAKILFPEKFEEGAAMINEKQAASIAAFIEKYRDNPVRFLEPYSKLAFIDKTETRNRLPISPKDWVKIVNWVHNQPAGRLRALAASLAEFARPDKDRTVLLDMEDWELCLQDLKANVNRTDDKSYAFRDMLKLALPLKFLQVAEEDET